MSQSRAFAKRFALKIKCIYYISVQCSLKFNAFRKFINNHCQFLSVIAEVLLPLSHTRSSSLQLPETHWVRKMLSPVIDTVLTLTSDFQMYVIFVQETAVNSHSSSSLVFRNTDCEMCLVLPMWVVQSGSEAVINNKQ